MLSTLEIDNKKLHSIKAAAALTTYSRDYITRLAREQKIVASQIGRQWFIDIDSLRHYETIAAIEQKIRQQQLSEERKQERFASEVVEKKIVAKHKKGRIMAGRSKILALAVLTLGIMSGTAFNQASLALPALDQQLASAPGVQGQNKNVVAVVAPEVISEVFPQAQVLDFASSSVEIKTLTDANSGILLLPDSVTASSSLNPADFFSDEVTVLFDESGRRYVTRLNDKDEVIEKIPFVVVPINSSETP